MKFKTPGDGRTRTAIHSVSGEGWLRGSTLLAKFKAGDVGVHFDLTHGYPAVAEKGAPVVQIPEILDSAERLAGAEFGVLVRTPAG